MVAALVKDIATGVENMGFDSRAGQNGHGCEQLATAEIFL